MTDYTSHADHFFELSALRGEFALLAFDHFELRDQHFGQSRWLSNSGAGSPHEQAAAVRGALAGEGSELTDYWYFPSGKHNPYLDLLYSDMAAHGMRAREMPRFDDIYELPAGSTLHLHWVESLRPNGTDEAQNVAALDRARAALRSFVAEPTNTLVWSVHEPLPHDSLWPAHDAEFYQFLANTAHIVHVLHEATAASCAEFFTIDPTKTICAALPLYSGVYPSFRTRANSRALLGLGADELCIVFFGALRAYKGIEQLLDAANDVAARRPTRLLIAGMPVGDVDELVAHVDRIECAAIAPMLIPDSEIQTLMSAADVLVVPYVRFLNSAVLMLGLSFGIPVIATENPVTNDARASGMVTTYQTNEELIAALSAAQVGPSLTIDPVFAAAHAPQAIAAEFAGAITDNSRS